MFGLISFLFAGRLASLSMRGAAIDVHALVGCSVPCLPVCCRLDSSEETGSAAVYYMRAMLWPQTVSIAGLSVCFFLSCEAICLSKQLGGQRLQKQQRAPAISIIILY